MAVAIFPCRGCPLKDGCNHRAELSRRASGLGARSIAFPCDRLGAEIRLGRRIVIRQPVAHFARGYESDGYDIRHAEVPATITSVGKHYKFAATIDPGVIPYDPEVSEAYPETEAEKFRFRKTQRHSRVVRFLDEPDRQLCEAGRVKIDGPARCDHGDDECWCAAQEAAFREFDGDQRDPFDFDPPNCAGCGTPLINGECADVCERCWNAERAA